MAVEASEIMAADFSLLPPQPEQSSDESCFPVEGWIKRKRSKRRSRFFDRAPSEEEYLALCLLMLAREDGSASFQQPQNMEHKCSICGRSFLTYQALGGHKTCHRKPLLVFPGNDRLSVGSPAASSSSSVGGKVHQCLICLKTFSTGQALGGHKRCHYDGTIGSAAGAGSAVTASSGTASQRVFDLNLPPVTELACGIGRQNWTLEEEDEVQSPLPFKKARLPIITA